jgi:hypothetical protein
MKCFGSARFGSAGVPKFKIQNSSKTDRFGCDAARLGSARLDLNFQNSHDFITGDLGALLLEFHGGKTM